MRRRHLLTGLCCLSPAMGALPALAGVSLRMRDLYTKSLEFSDLARSLDGKPVAIDGFMAPPLKAESRFFVLTKRPMSVCPFCESEAEWPADIVAVYAADIVRILPFNVPITTRGVLDLGTFEDLEYGFISRVRLVDADFHRS